MDLAHQAFLSFIISQSLLKLMSIESVMTSNHLILSHPLLLLSSIFPSIKVFSNESALCIRWPNYWSFSFRISPSSEYSGLISKITAPRTSHLGDTQSITEHLPVKIVKFAFSKMGRNWKLHILLVRL